MNQKEYMLLCKVIRLSKRREHLDQWSDKTPAETEAALEAIDNLQDTLEHALKINYSNFKQDMFRKACEI